MKTLELPFRQRNNVRQFPGGIDRTLPRYPGGIDPLGVDKTHLAAQRPAVDPHHFPLPLQQFVKRCHQPGR